MTRSSGSPPRPSSPLPGEADATAGCHDAHVLAMTVVPGQKGTAGVEEIPDPDMQDSTLLVQGMAVGICGTDREMAEGTYGTPPSGEARLVIGHESLGAVLEAPAGSGFTPGDLVAGIRRRADRPDGLPARRTARLRGARGRSRTGRPEA